MTAPDFSLIRDSYGRLVLTAKNGETHEGVVPVRAFPIAAPDEGIALINAEGHEVGWADRLVDLPPALSQLIEEELASREFVPEIEHGRGARFQQGRQVAGRLRAERIAAGAQPLGQA